MGAARSITRLRVRIATVVVALLAGGCADEGPQGPVPPGPPAALSIVSGDGQTGVAGTQLPQPLVVRVTDVDGQPVPDQVVNFVVTSGGGEVFAGAALTNDDGVAQELWTLGTSTADSQRLEVRAVDAETGQPLVFAHFEAVILPDAPAHVVIVGEGARIGAPGETLGDSLAVLVTDQYANPVPDADVTWTVEGGRGLIDPGVTATDSAGVARAAWTLGPRADTTHVATAEVASLDVLTFTAEPVLPVELTIAVTGDDQVGVVGEQLPDSLVVTVSLPGGEPLQGAVVRWSVAAGGGDVGPSEVVTDSLGRATAEWTLGTTSGTHTAIAAVGVADTAAFTATAGAGAAFAIEASSPDTARTAGSSAPIRARVLDIFGNGVPGTTVVWTPGTGSGSVNPSQSVSDANGFAETTWTLGPTADTQSVAAALVGVGSVVWRFVARADVASDVDIGPDSTSIAFGDTAVYAWSQFDHLGNPVPGEPAVHSADTSVARVLSVAAGEIRILGAGVGSTWIVGTTDGVSDSARIDVRPIAFTSVVAGFYATCGMTAADGLYCWGYKLSLDDIGGPRSASPYEITEPMPVRLDISFEQFHMGASAWDANATTACGVTVDGRGFCWGSNSRGTVGDGTTTDRAAPTEVAGGYTWSSIQTGGMTCGLSTEGAAYCWGSLYGRDGTNLVPTAVPGGHAFTQISVGTIFGVACGVSNREVYCWHDDLTEPWRLEAPFPIVEANYGDGLCVLAEAGDVYCEVSSEWRLVPGGVQFRSLSSAGRYGGCGLGTDDIAYCWGGASAEASPISDLRFSELPANRCGITLDGRLHCRGSNHFGQVGVGYTSTSVAAFTPVVGQTP